ncbi:hypothetical protein V2J09_007091 [Rumex salicifolius]
MELGIPGSGNGFGSGSLDVEASKQKWSMRSDGSGLFGGDAWRASKMAKTEADFSIGANAAASSDANMLRFSSCTKLETSALPDFHQMEAPLYRSSGYYTSGSLDASTGVYLLSGVGGPFTPSQWLELEQQALIYRYITANQPIPVHLLIPIRKAFESAGFYSLNGGALKSTACEPLLLSLNKFFRFLCMQNKSYPCFWIYDDPGGWGPFHLGYSNSTDPEPGRCRRTDGKKWRCSKEAVANQKYCDKHMNRGRHRSRKHVECQGTASQATKSSSTKPVLPGSGSSNSFDRNQYQNIQGKNLQPTSSNPNMNTSLNRIDSGQALQDATQLSFISQGNKLNYSGSSFSSSKHQISSQEPTLNGFGALSSSEHLLDSASQKSYGSYANILTDPKEHKSRDSLFTLLDNWPKNSHVSADFMSSTSSPTNEKAADLSPLRLSQEHETGSGFQSSRLAANWNPVSWDASMGGPLAEALQTNSIINYADDESKKNSGPSLLPKGWERNGSSQLSSSSSPTGVLQRSSLVSLSNSSAGSSPRAADNSKTIESGGSQ